MRWTLVLALLAVEVAGCAARSSVAWPPEEPGVVKHVWVVRHGWHTRVAVRREDVDPSIWPESRDLGDVVYVEVGWGDRDFYPEPAPSLWDAIDAVIRPTPAALHVGGFDRPPSQFLPEAPVIRLPVSAAGFERLCRFIAAHYVHGADGDPIRMRPGYYERSWFYLANGGYHALHNSNNWVAEALHAAGVPVSPAWALTAGLVMWQAGRLEPAVRPDQAAGR